MINPWKSQSKINPQRENGNRQLANEVYRELIRANLSAVDYKIVFHVIDITWGYNKTSAVSAISQIMEATSLAERTVKKGVKALKNMRVIFYQPSKTVHRGAPLNEYLFNKHYDTWVVDKPVDKFLKKGCTGVHGCTDRARKGARIGQKGVSMRAPLKRNDKEKKESMSKLGFNNIDRTIETILGKHAPRETIARVLSRLNKTEYWRVQKFLIKRYPGDGNKAYQKALSVIGEGT